MSGFNHAALSNGTYTEEELRLIQDINSRALAVKKPMNPVYRKDDLEHMPTWRQKREVHYSN